MRKMKAATKLAAVGLIAVGLTAMTASTRQDNFYSQIDGQSYPIAYTYTIYDTNGNVVGGANDRCTGGPFVASPQLPTGLYDEYPAYACASYGPYLPPDWPY